MNVTEKDDMPKFLIERNIPNAGKLSAEDLQAISQKSNSVLSDMARNGHQVQWNHSYVTDDALYCEYVAEDAEAVREHARCGGFPVDRIIQVQTMIDPTTAE